jgi:hypothetical protein
MKERGVNRKGQGVLGMPFSVIFSIIIIVAVIAVAVYAIVYFLNLQECTDAGLFYDELQDEVDKAWRSSIYRDVFSGELPSGIEYVCFGYLNQSVSGSGNREMRDELADDYGRSRDNVFLYPRSGACSIELASLELDRVEINSFFCVEKKEGEVKVRLSKGSFDSLVEVSEG